MDGSSQHMLAGWYALDVMRKQSRKWDWVALMIDVHPDEFKSYRTRAAREKWVPIPGKHRNYEAAWDAMEQMLETRH